MNEIVEILLPVDARAARSLDTPDRRAEAGRLLGELIREQRRVAVLASLDAVRAEALANGITDEIVDA